MGSLKVERNLAVTALTSTNAWCHLLTHPGKKFCLISPSCSPSLTFSLSLSLNLPSLSPLSLPPPMNFLLTAYFLSFPSAFPFFPRSATTELPETLHKRLHAVCYRKRSVWHLQCRNDLVMWHSVDKPLFCKPDPNSTEISEGLPVSPVSLEQAHSTHLDVVCSGGPALSHLLSGITFWSG